MRPRLETDAGGAVVVVAVFLLAQWPIFEPDTSISPVLLGGADARARSSSESDARVATARTGREAGGRLSPAAGSTRPRSRPRSSRARASCRPRLVTGQDEADVVAYVVSIATP